MSAIRARLARLQRLQAAVDQGSAAAAAQRYMRQPDGAPRHALPLMTKLRRGAAAMAVDWCTSLEAVETWLVADGWAVTPDMLEAAAVRLASRAALYPEPPGRAGLTEETL